MKNGSENNGSTLRPVRPTLVIPAKAGIHYLSPSEVRDAGGLTSFAVEKRFRFRGNDELGSLSLKVVPLSSDAFSPVHLRPLLTRAALGLRLSAVRSIRTAPGRALAQVAPRKPAWELGPAAIIPLEAAPCLASGPWHLLKP